MENNTFFEVPDMSGIESMDADEVQSAIGKLTAQMANEAHPLSPTRQSIDPRKSEFMNYRQKLYERAAYHKSQEPNTFEVAMQQKDEREAAQSKHLLAQAKTVMQEGEKLGLEPNGPIPENVTMEEIRLQRIQNCVYGDDMAGAANLMYETMRDLGEKPSVVRAFGSLMDAGDEVDSEVRKEIIDIVLKHYYKFYRNKKQ
jgi:hypothetical protein